MNLYLQAILEHMGKNIPYFRKRMDETGWKDKVRRVLGSNADFVNMGTGGKVGPLSLKFHKVWALKAVTDANKLKKIEEELRPKPTKHGLKIPSWKCSMCRNGYLEEEDLKEHIDETHDGKVFCGVHSKTEALADACQKLSETRVSVKEEISIDDNVTQSSPDEPSEEKPLVKISGDVLYGRYKRKRYEKRLITCPCCDFVITYGLLHVLDSHITMNHYSLLDEAEPKTNCSQCSFACRLKVVLNTHVAVSHGEGEPPSNSKNDFAQDSDELRCPECPFTCLHSSMLGLHLEFGRHNQKKQDDRAEVSVKKEVNLQGKFGCDTENCGYRTNFRSNLTKHCRGCSHSSVLLAQSGKQYMPKMSKRKDEGKFVCECGYSTNHRGHFNTHCTNYSHRSSSLSPHLEKKQASLAEVSVKEDTAEGNLQHDKVGKFECETLKCGYKTNSHSNLLRHYRRRTHCSASIGKTSRKQYIPRPSLRKNEGEFFCDTMDCGYRTKRRGHLKVHCNDFSHHSSSLSPEEYLEKNPTDLKEGDKSIDQDMKEKVDICETEEYDSGIQGDSDRTLHTGSINCEDNSSAFRADVVRQLKREHANLENHKCTQVCLTRYMRRKHKERLFCDTDDCGFMTKVRLRLRKHCIRLSHRSSSLSPEDYIRSKPGRRPKTKWLFCDTDDCGFKTKVRLRLRKHCIRLSHQSSSLSPEDYIRSKPGRRPKKPKSQKLFCDTDDCGYKTKVWLSLRKHCIQLSHRSSSLSSEDYQKGKWRRRKNEGKFVCDTLGCGYRSNFHVSMKGHCYTLSHQSSSLSTKETPHGLKEGVEDESGQKPEEEVNDNTGKARLKSGVVAPVQPPSEPENYVQELSSVNPKERLDVARSRLDKALNKTNSINMKSEPLATEKSPALPKGTAHATEKSPGLQEGKFRCDTNDCGFRTSVWWRLRSHCLNLSHHSHSLSPKDYVKGNRRKDEGEFACDTVGCGYRSKFRGNLKMHCNKKTHVSSLLSSKDYLKPSSEHVIENVTVPNQERSDKADAEFSYPESIEYEQGKALRKDSGVDEAEPKKRKISATVEDDIEVEKCSAKAKIGDSMPVLGEITHIGDIPIEDIMKEGRQVPVGAEAKLKSGVVVPLGLQPTSESEVSALSAVNPDGERSRMDLDLNKTKQNPSSVTSDQVKSDRSPNVLNITRLVANECKECHKVFREKRALFQGHIMRKHFTDKKPIQCTICKGILRDSSHLDEHMLLHQGNFKIELCRRIKL